MTQQRGSKLVSRRIYKEVEEHTQEARARWSNSPSPVNWEDDPLPRAFGVNTMIEEAGKVSRAVNKLVIANPETSEYEKWNREAKSRLISTMSMCRRLLESWDDLPDRL